MIDKASRIKKSETTSFSPIPNPKAKDTTTVTESDTKIINRMVKEAKDYDGLVRYPNLRTRYEQGPITPPEVEDFKGQFSLTSAKIQKYDAKNKYYILSALENFFAVNMTEESQMSFCSLINSGIFEQISSFDPTSLLSSLSIDPLASTAMSIKDQLIGNITSVFEMARTVLEGNILRVSNLQTAGSMQEPVCRKLDRDISKCNSLLSHQNEEATVNGVDSSVASFAQKNELTAESLMQLGYMLCKTQSNVQTSVMGPVTRLSGQIDNVETTGYQLQRSSAGATYGAVAAGALRYSPGVSQSAGEQYYANVEGGPENWPAIRRGIFAGESGGDYNALFGFSNRSGGRFSTVKLTDMTVDEAIAFSSPGGEYANWSVEQLGYIATPMGGYQIVGTTLRGLKGTMGLTGSELMTPELQERMGQQIYAEQGTGAWAGYKGPIYDASDANTVVGPDGVAINRDANMTNVPKEVTPEEIANVVVWKHPGIGDARIAFGGGLQDGRMGEEGWIKVDIRLRVIAHRIQRDWGQRLTINSGYRSPAYNSGVGGVTKSYHMSGLALDISWDGSSDSAQRDQFISLARSHGIGGCGSYGGGNNFVHIDLGPTRQWVS